MKHFTLILSAVTVLAVLVVAKASAQNFDVNNPLGFFTNAASRLLSSEINLNLTQIEIYPTNQYTPAVHRLLQVAVNVYDATRTNFYPSIFRPLFTVDGSGNVFITGYACQTSLIAQATEMVPGANNDILDPPVEAAALPVGQNILTNVYGVPWIIGAKKGLPNFNAFSIESAFQLMRKLEVVRNTNTVPQPNITWTNQMYVMDITNFMALSCWNSYRSNYPGPVDILVRCSSTMMLTNDDNMFPYVFTTNFAFATEIAPNWPAWNGVLTAPSASFLVPLNTSVLALTNAIYYYNEPNPPYSGELLYYQGDGPNNYLDAGIRELPHFVLLMTNQLQVAIIDYSTNASPLNASGPVVGRIVDYVQLDGLDNSQLLNAALDENGNDSLWNTNYDPNGNLLGVENQFYVSAFGTTLDGNVPTSLGAWTTAQIPGGPNVTSPAAQQAFFRGFFAKDGGYNYGGQFYVNTQTVVPAPYTPIAFAVQHTTWGANDPLVHYLASDLAPYTQNLQVVDWGFYNPQIPNDNYQPWGVAPPTYEFDVDKNPCNLALKDPLVYSSDFWNFPTGQISNPNWLGQVHRGTPWQTIYLKSPDILAEANGSDGYFGDRTWINWTGDENLADATAMAPVQDWHLASLLASLLNTNSPSTLVSVNDPDTNAWLVLLDGMTALTNISTDIQIRFSQFVPPQFVALVVSSNSPQASIIASAIESARMNQPGQSFSDIGDVLAIPQLAEQSPFLNVSSTIQRTNGISDAAYEAIPSQLLPLLRVDSVGSAASANGRTVIQFTGSDGHVYALEASSDLVNWTRISTNWPASGLVNFTNYPALNIGAQFYRSVLLQ